MKKSVIVIVLLFLFSYSFCQDIYELKNDYVQIKVKKTGAELCGIKLLSNGKDYMWNGNPKVWGGFSPVLFPIVGVIKDDSYFFEGKKYTMSIHGFFQRNPNVTLKLTTDSSLTFALKYNEETLKKYPFEFEFLITYTLRKSKVVITHEVQNLGSKDMYFSTGGHPSFKCPMEAGEKYSDYYLEFDKAETANTYPIGANGLLDKKADLILNNSRVINLNYHMFDKGALVFKDIKSRKVCLCSKISGKRVEVDYEGFPYIGFWAMPNADYICIEPWLGINDSANTNQDIKTKEGILKLSGNSTFKAAYSISVF